MLLAEQEDHACGCQRPKKCRQHRGVEHHQRGQREREHHPQGDGQRRTAADPEQARVGKRIAEQPLHDAAGERQRPANHQRQQHAGQTDGEPDLA